MKKLRQSRNKVATAKARFEPSPTRLYSREAHHGIGGISTGKK